MQKSDKSIIAYGIVITPDCDLEQQKTRHFEIVELIPINDTRLGFTPDQINGIKNSRNDSFYYFPALAIGGELTDFVAILKSKLILIETTDLNQPKYPNASKRLLYSLNFLCNGGNVKLNLICSKTNPYKSDFLQKLHANNSRVGIPDIKDLFK